MCGLWYESMGCRSKSYEPTKNCRRDRKPAEDLKQRRRSQSSLDDLRTDDLIVSNNQRRRNSSGRGAHSGNDNAPPRRNSTRNMNGDVKKPPPSNPASSSPPRPKSALRQHKSVAGGEPFRDNSICSSTFVGSVGSWENVDEESLALIC